MLYLSQRDPKWAQTTLGNTQMTLARVGCTTTCVSMASSYFGKYLDPGNMAKTLEYTAGALLLWESVKNAGMSFVWRGYKEDRGMIDEALKNPSKVCLLNVDKGAHWVLGVKRLVGGTYWVVDPWTGTKKLYSGVVGFSILKG